MNGAHCPVCRDLGPELQVRELTDWRSGDPVEAFPTVMGHLEFTCPRCAKRWLWRVLYAGGAWRYVLVVPGPTRPPGSTVN
jgi:hypothetical protein